MINLTIDGIQVTVPKGSTILQAAAQAGIRIPTLCWHPDQAVKAISLLHPVSPGGNF
jgi:NADH-quinone oxidoreductase subunit G